MTMIIEVIKGHSDTPIDHPRSSSVTFHKRR